MKRAISCVFAAWAMVAAAHADGPVLQSTNAVTFLTFKPCREADKTQFDAFGADYDKTPATVTRSGLKLTVFGKRAGQKELARADPTYDVFGGPAKALIAKVDGSDPHYLIFDYAAPLPLRVEGPGPQHAGHVVRCGRVENAKP